MALAMNPEGRIELALDPEELGPVRLGLVPGDGSVVVHLAADRAETLDLLRRHVDFLARDLRQSGYGDVTFRFGSETPSGGHQPHRHSYDGQAAQQTAADTTPTATQGAAIAAPRSTRPGGLDLRL
jgi:flagellar hook-length control protein FliK